MFLLGNFYVVKSCSFFLCGNLCEYWLKHINFSKYIEVCLYIHDYKKHLYS